MVMCGGRMLGSARRVEKVGRLGVGLGRETSLFCWVLGCLRCIGLCWSLL